MSYCSHTHTEKMKGPCTPICFPLLSWFFSWRERHPESKGRGRDTHTQQQIQQKRGGGANFYYYFLKIGTRNQVYRPLYSSQIQCRKKRARFSNEKKKIQNLIDLFPEIPSMPHTQRIRGSLSLSVCVYSIVNIRWLRERKGTEKNIRKEEKNVQLWWRLWHISLCAVYIHGCLSFIYIYIYLNCIHYSRFSFFSPRTISRILTNPLFTFAFPHVLSMWGLCAVQQLAVRVYIPGISSGRVPIHPHALWEVEGFFK